MTGASLTEEDQGGIESYESGSGLAYSTYGGKRRTRRTRGKRNSRKRNSRKRSQRKSKKYMKKMYRGGNNDENNEEKEQSQESQESQSEESREQKQDQDGGKRRRKGKMYKGKSRKGKISSWITHVKNFSKANKMDFRDALKDPKCKASYHKMK
jgi:hypothetical protein